jgi:flavin-dependent dehydrogenase
VARHLRGVSAPTETVVVAQEVEFELRPEERAGCPVDAAVPELFFTADLEGYGWIFRKGDFLNVGLGRRDTRGLSAHVAEFIAFLRGEGRLPARLPGSFRGHSYLVYEDSPRPVAGEGFLLLGDAAGLAYGRSGEGIRPAVESGLLAAGVIRAAPGRTDRDHLDAYRVALEDRFGRRGQSEGVALMGLLPVHLAQRVAGWLLGNRLFARRVVVDRWFVQSHRPPLPSA